MKKKGLKNLAKKIADAELRLRNSTNSLEIRTLQDEIIRLSSKVSLSEMNVLDELIQSYINHKD